MSLIKWIRITFFIFNDSGNKGNLIEHKTKLNAPVSRRQDSRSCPLMKQGNVPQEHFPTRKRPSAVLNRWVESCMGASLAQAMHSRRAWFESETCPDAAYDQRCALSRWNLCKYLLDRFTKCSFLCIDWSAKDTGK